VCCFFLVCFFLVCFFLTPIFTQLKVEMDMDKRVQDEKEKETLHEWMTDLELELVLSENGWYPEPPVVPNSVPVVLLQVKPEPPARPRPVLPNAAPIQIFIKNLQGPNMTLDVDMADDTDTVKKRIFDKEGIPVAQQRLFFGTKELVGNVMLASYHIKNESNVTLHLSLRGGADDAPMPQQQQMAQQQPKLPPTVEQEVARHLRSMNEGFKKFKQRKFGIKATPYTTPLRPSAGALDKKRFLLDKNVK